MDLKFALQGALFVLFCCIFYGLFKLVLYIIDYFLFKKISAAIIDLITASDSSTLKDENINERPEIDDEWRKDRDKDKEVALEKLESKTVQQGKESKKIIGISMKNMVFGLWTRRYIEKMMQKWQNVDMNRVRDRLSKIDPDGVSNKDLFRIMNSEAIISKLNDKNKDARGR